MKEKAISSPKPPGIAVPKFVDTSVENIYRYGTQILKMPNTELVS